MLSFLVIRFCRLMSGTPFTVEFISVVRLHAILRLCGRLYAGLPNSVAFSHASTTVSLGLRQFGVDCNACMILLLLGSFYVPIPLKLSLLVLMGKA